MRKEKHYNSADLRERKILTGYIAVTAVLVLLWILVTAVKYGFSEPSRERTNPEQSGTARVYDYADMLTDEQEMYLETRIAEVEEQILGDIVIVTENQSFEELYGAVYDSEDEDSAYDCIRRYANSFWDEGGFGWNVPGDRGNGIIMVDNVYRESNGYVYNWVAGSGDMRHKVGNNACQKLSEAFTERLPSTKGLDDLALQYTDEYYNALMAFLDDCERFGELVKGTQGWAAFSPSGVSKNIGSSFIYVIILVVILAVLFFVRMNAIRAADPDYSKAGIDGIARGGTPKWHLNVSGAVTTIIISVAVLIGAVTEMAWISVLGIIAVVLLRNGFKKSADKAKEEPMGEDKGKAGVQGVFKGKNKKRGFSVKEALEPEAFDYTRTEDTFVRTYTTSVTHSDSSSGGGGGGHSGGGSHR